MMGKLGTNRSIFYTVVSEIFLSNASNELRVSVNGLETILGEYLEWDLSCSKLSGLGFCQTCCYITTYAEPEQKNYRDEPEL